MNQVTTPQALVNTELRMMVDRAGMDMGDVCDGYHTFNELYEFRLVLTDVLFRKIRNEAWGKYRPQEGDSVTFDSSTNPIWRSELHSDGTMFDGWFIIGCFKEPGKMITFHYPMSVWGMFNYATILERAPEWDRHTNTDVLQRIKNL